MKLMKRVMALLLCFLILTAGPISAFATEGANDNDIVVCTECGAAEGHTAECAQYVAPVTKCEHCGIELTEGAVHADDCLTLCTCTPVDGVHQEGCKFYEAPVTKCEHCGIELTEGAVHLDTCLTLCTCEPVEGVHQEGCKFYEAPVEDIAEDNGPQVGDKIWIVHDSYVYRDQSAENGHKLLLNYEVEIVNIITDESGAAEWYEFKFLNLGLGEIALSMGGYKYVHVDNTSVEEPDEDAGSGKETTVGDTVIRVTGVPEDVSLNVSGVSEEQYHSDLDKYIDQNSELLYVYDITLTNPDNSVWQPQSGQSVTVTLDFMGLGLPDGNKINVLHEHDGGLRPLGEYSIEDGKLSFKTDGFSKFYFYITYTFGGHVFTMSGGSTVYLSEILQEMSIPRSVSEVSGVHFSNPDVLKITQIGTDWELESLASFGSEETLTITFTDGEIIEIAVEDPVIFNYAVENDITNVPKLETTQRTVASVNNGDTTAQGKTYIVNKAQITVDNVKSAGVAEKATGTHPAPDAVHMIIYATEGMAIDFIGGTDWTYEGSRPTFADSGIWFWAWESAKSANYAIIKAGSAGKQAKFTVTTTVDNRMYYCNVLLCVIEKSKPTLLANNLPNGYSIKNVPVTLYNYDGKAFNTYYEGQNANENYFAFSGTAMGVDSREGATPGWTTSGKQANGGGSVALMGIMKDTLVNGLPVVSQGQQVDVFSEDAIPGKTVCSDVDFQFVYNENTGYYSYNSALNHAQYNSKEKTLELYVQSLAPSDTPAGDSHGNAGFYPFEDINKAYTNTGYTSMTVETWKEKLEKDAFELIPAQYSTDIVTTSSTNPASTAEVHYGLQVKSDFYLPEGKKINGQEMIYEFTGDDDLWVYIDGKLVLDIGGGHTYVSGSFNLTTGKVWVEKYTKLAADDGGYYPERVEGENLGYTDSFLTGLEDDQMHTIQIFYLERHGGVSNCRMRFNLPLVPSESVYVSKNLVNQEGKKLSVTPDVDYTFTLFTAADNDDNGDATGFSAYANEDYTVTGNGAPSGTQKTDANGQFKLKDGWIAIFQGIPRFTNVYVVESNPNDGYTYNQSTVSVNKDDATEYTFGSKTATKVMQLNESINFAFVNKMQTQPLTIEKQVVNGADGLINPEQKFQFTLDFTKAILETGTGAIAASDKSDTAVALTDGGIFELGHAESVTIPRVPVNMTFTLMETNPDTNNSFDAPIFAADTCTSTEDPVPNAYAFGMAYHWKINNGATNKIVVTNQQRFNLTITKDGISKIDHDSDEQQSTIYTIVGKIGNTVLVEMDVAICGNDSVTICKLPVGSYTVKENTDWSWRYDPDGGATRKVAIPQDANASETYRNDRTKQYWLSGDSYCENWWGNNGDVIRKETAYRDPTDDTQNT